jgi:hypothetical protein
MKIEHLKYMKVQYYKKMSFLVSVCTQCSSTLSLGYITIHKRFKKKKNAVDADFRYFLIHFFFFPYLQMLTSQSRKL